jgi:glycerol-3-phosphate acyltransferase PlsX
MGATLVSALEGKERPSVGLLNIGSEEMKGNEVVKKAGELLRQSPLNFHGNVEATTSTRAPPTWWCATASPATWRSRPPRASPRCWGTSSRRNTCARPLTRLAAFVSMPVIKRFRQRVDHRRYNGAALLGLRASW